MLKAKTIPRANPFLPREKKEDEGGGSGDGGGVLKNSKTRAFYKETLRKT